MLFAEDTPVIRLICTACVARPARLCPHEAGLARPRLVARPFPPFAPDAVSMATFLVLHYSQLLLRRGSTPIRLFSRHFSTPEGRDLSPCHFCGVPGTQTSFKAVSFFYCPPLSLLPEFIMKMLCRPRSPSQSLPFRPWQPPRSTPGVGPAVRQLRYGTESVRFLVPSVTSVT